MYKERLRRILASEGMLKSAVRIGEIYVGEGSRDPSGHPDFATAMAWLKKVASDKTLIDNTRNDRPFERIVIELRRGSLHIEISGTVEEEEKTWESNVNQSFGGDYLISDSGFNYTQVLVRRSLTIKEVGRNWEVEAHSYSESQTSYGSKQRAHIQNTSRSLTTALKFALATLKTMA